MYVFISQFPLPYVHFTGVCTFTCISFLFEILPMPFVFLCENVNNDQYVCVHVALTQHCVVFAIIN